MLVEGKLAEDGAGEEVEAKRTHLKVRHYSGEKKEQRDEPAATKEKAPASEGVRYDGAGS